MQYLLLLLVTLIGIISANNTTTCEGITGFNKDTMDFSAWDNVLKRHVSAGKIADVPLNVVNYSAVARDPDFAHFGCQLRASDTTGLSYEQWYAFHINAYNYYAVWTIIENACLKGLLGNCTSLTSIQQVGFLWPSFTFTPKVWSMASLEIANQTVSLDDIENERLRDPRKGGFDIEDPRLHACIVCASVSCPNLRAEAYTVANLDQQMQNNTKEFLANNAKGLKLENGKLTISPIFHWFADDFKNGSRADIRSASMNLSSFLIEHVSSSEIVKFIQENAEDINNGKTQVFKYDWNLNGEVGDLCTTKGFCLSPLILVIVGGALLVVILVIAIACATKKKDNYGRIH